MLLRRPDEARRPTLLELLLDLVYVVALALISQRLADRPGWRAAVDSLLLLLAVWVVWTATVLITNLYDPHQPTIQLLTVYVLVGSLLMTTAIPRAFDRHGLTFAVAYVGIHLGRGLLLVPALRGQRNEWRRGVRVLAWFAVSAVPWLAGGVADGTDRTVLWAVALAIDYAAAALRYPVPRLRRVPAPHLLGVAEHLSERFQQFFIITLGDAILVIGIELSRGDLTAGRLAAFLVTLGTTVLLWRIYVHRAGELLPVALNAAREPARLTQWAPFTHLAMVAGVVITAAGFHFVIRDPTGATRTGWAILILGGPALFLAGRSRFEYEIFRRVSPARPIGILLLAVAAPGVRHLPVLVVTTVAGLVLAGVAGADAMRSYHRPPEPPAPKF